jgi:hypothetical protein
MWRLVYDPKTKQVIMAEEATHTHTETQHTVEEFETEAEMEKRIDELGLRRAE